MIMLDNMKQINFNWENMPNYWRLTNTAKWNTYIKCGEVKDSYNPYFATEEKQCANHICRLLSPNKTIDKALVIRDDGTVWSIYLSNFKQIELINII